MRVNRRQFLASSSAAAGALVLTQSGAAGAAELGRAVSSSDPRVIAARSSRAAELAARAFGEPNWAGVRVGEDGDLFVPLATRDGSPTLLVVAAGSDRALASAARGTGDDALFSGSLVVQLRQRDVATLAWSAVDGRELASWQVEGEHRVAFASAGAQLARGLDHSPLAFASSVRPLEPSGRARRDAGLLHRAGARGARGIRLAAAA